MSGDTLGPPAPSTDDNHPFDLQAIMEMPDVQEAGLTEEEINYMQEAADRIVTADVPISEFQALVSEMDTEDCALEDARKDTISGLIATHILSTCTSEPTSKPHQKHQD
jgi:hypothetical protein